MDPEDLLGQDQGPPAGADELRAIVARAGRKRWRWAAGGVVAALLAGGAIGYGVSNHSGHSGGGQTLVAGPSGSSSTVAGAGNQGAAIAPGAGPSAEPGSGSSGTGSSGSGSSGAGSSPAVVRQPGGFTHVFTRTSGAVTMRGFLSSVAQPVPNLTGVCVVGGPAFQAEVSTAGMVGTLSAWSRPATANIGRAITATTGEVLGSAEGDPVAVVAVAVVPEVARVRVEFAAGGSDEMAPVKGWSALAVVVPGNQRASANETVIGTAQALGSSGQVLASAQVGTGLSPIPSTRLPCPLSGFAGGGTDGSSPEPAGGSSGVTSSPTSTGTGTSPGQPAARSGSAFACPAQVAPSTPAQVEPVPAAVPGASSGSSSR